MLTKEFLGGVENNFLPLCKHRKASFRYLIEETIVFSCFVLAAKQLYTLKNLYLILQLTMYLIFLYFAKHQMRMVSLNEFFDKFELLDMSKYLCTHRHFNLLTFPCVIMCLNNLACASSPCQCICPCSRIYAT